MQETLERALTVREVGRYLGKGLPWVRAEITSGRLAGFRVGDELRVTKDSLDAYIDAHRATGPIACRAPRRRAAR